MQQTAVACQSKAFTHMLQIDLYSTMYTLGNSILLRCETEMTHLQHHLEQTRCQELRNSPFWSSPLFQFKLVKEGAEFHRKKAPRKTVRVLNPIRISPFMPLYRKCSYGDHSTRNSNQSFSSGRENIRGSRGNFEPHARGRGHGNPSSQ